MYRVAQGICWFVFYSNAFGSEVFNDGSISLSSLLSGRTERERAKEGKTFGKYSLASI